MAIIDRIVRHIKWRVNHKRHFGIYDKSQPQSVWEIETLRKAIELFRIDCIFDIGANRGQYAKMLREQVGFEGPIISFEPIPEVALELEKQSKLDKNWHVETLAISSKTGIAQFNVMGDSQFSSFNRPSTIGEAAFSDKNEVERKITVKCETLADSYSRLNGKFKFTRPFLKMDTQGHDIEIIRASQEVAKFFVGIQSELSFIPIYNDVSSFDTALELYRSLGFELSALVPNNAGHFPKLYEIDCIMMRPDMFNPPNKG